MISDLWTLEPAGSPGLAQPLRAMGVTGANLTRRNQAAATLSLTISTGNALTAAIVGVDWESRWVLRRGNDVAFRGRVSSVPRSGVVEGETLAIELRDLWWDLERTPYLQAWDHLTAQGIEQRRIPRALLGVADGARQTTFQCLQQIVAAAASADAPFALQSSLPALICPRIEAANLSCADLIRAVLRYHPGATATIVSTATSDTLRVCDRSLASAVSLPAAGRPVVDLSIHPRPDLVADSVHVHYEAEATHWTAQPVEPDETPGLVARRRLAIFSDVYPINAQPTRRSMVVALPSPPLADPPPPPVPHVVPVQTRALPASGSVGDVAEKWWLDMLGLTSLGLTKDDIVLPPPDSEAAQPHRVRFAWQVDDPDDPLQAPSAINPASKPLWRPPDVEDLPRMLVSGALAEWMRVEAAEVVVDATVGVRKSAVDALDERERAIFMRLNPEHGAVGGVDAYRIHREVRVIGTTAKTKIYYNWPSGATYNPAADLAASIEAARAEAVVPDLARRLWQERSTTPWEGTLTISAEEAGATRFLSSNVLSLAGGRNEWSSMRAVIQGETLDLDQGITTIDFGPPEHLSPQDHAELWGVARRARTARAEAAQSPPSPLTEVDTMGTTPGSGGVFPPTVLPKREIELTGGGGGVAQRLWGLEVVDAEAGTVRLVRPGQIKRTSALDSSGLVTVTGISATFTAAAGKLLVLEVLPTLETTLKMVDKWLGWPQPIDTVPSSPAGLWVVEKYYHVLWQFVAEGDSHPEDAVRIKDGLVAERRGYDANLQFTKTRQQDKDGHVVAAYELVPGMGAERST